ncbi:nucleotide sugar dehydrogenase [Gloeobacter kilaueensis]|uniref:Nucleotide sugar dehydrogenase n=1 Tax=Gloeobacter kilaueensis (strain ATCC BAA-2537 / CCAP 1431/1 / ULC 316 / JS1) TaxID=1183438 RepID=U5QGB4_GLOK1|nr:nucleotide sugar dehydrogenase [Gloeobacter kilaueensis]AGY56710.1 nucleotide sugar dehydrogenase [Gloeobacter kilaueensis JS1]
MHSPTLQLDVKSSLLRKIQTRTARIAIVGLGYVGLPLAVQFAKSGFAVTGMDVDESKLARLNAGTSYIQDVESSDLRQFVAAERLTGTSDFSRLREADAIIVCVPTPLDRSKKPDISYIVAAAENIQASLRPGQIIVLESTTYPGTTDEVLLPMFEQMGLQIDRDFFLAFSPERVDPGNPTFRTGNIPKLVGGVSADSTEVATVLYRTVVGRVHSVSSARTAETAKLLENTFRSVNIALVNEMAQLCRHLGIDVWEVVEAAGTKPFGFMKFYPGPGIGGHCIPLDPYYLSWKARLHGYEPRFIELAEEVNSHMPDYVQSLVGEALNSQRKCVNGADILILGVAYKPDIDDYRESPALRLMQKLHRQGARLRYSDPHVPVLPFLVDTESYILQSQPLDAASIAAADLVVVVTDHRAFDWQLVADNAALVVDTRNALAAHRDCCPTFHL